MLTPYRLLLRPLPALLLALACTTAPAAFAQAVAAPATLPALSAPAAPSAAGHYYGVLPCADCTGIAHLLLLHSDGRYRLRRIYLDKGHALFSESGHWSWNAEHSQLLLQGDTQALRLAWQNANTLALLDQTGQPIASSHGNYQLHRTTAAP